MAEDEKVSLEELIEAAENFDITKLTYRTVASIAKTKNLEEAMENPDTARFLTTTALILGCARRKKDYLTDEELAEEIDKLYIDICLEYLVRRRILVREGRWTYENSPNCRYRLVSHIDSG